MVKNQTYVYLHLRGDFVPAGLLTVMQTGTRVTSEFVYGRRYLRRKDAVALDPLQLPLAAHRFSSKGMFRVFQDASPDGWGRHLLDRAAEVHGHEPTEFEYLTVLDQQNRIGALAFGQDLDGPAPYRPNWRPKQVHGDTLDLEAMIKAADIILRLEELPLEYHRFLHRGSSMGGAQPKAAVDYEGRPCIAKFSREMEAWPTCRIEVAALHLAQACGIRTVTAKVIDVKGRDIFLAERFDRAIGGQRRHFMSARTIMGAEDMHSGSYGDIARGMRRFCHADTLHADLGELFRRMVLNILCNNTDDHLLNHGFLYSPGLKGWRLAPAYDIVPQPLMGDDTPPALTLGVGEQGTVATLENALSRCEDFGLKKDDARCIIDYMTETVARTWVQENLAQGVPATKIDSMREAFRFNLPL